MNVIASAIFMSLPWRTCRTFMPFWYSPEQMRMNAIRSRCPGSMFAWILNTNPVSLSRRLIHLDESGCSALVAAAERRRMRDEIVQQFLDTEIGQSRSRRTPAFAARPGRRPAIEFRARPA